MAMFGVNTDYSALSKTGAAASGTQGAATKKNDELGKEAFLNLLVTQLKNQDPLDPLKDTDFIAQLATFSNLEQMTTMSDTLTSFAKQQNYLNAAGLIGKEVTTATNFTGKVDRVGLDDGSIYLYAGDTKISLNDVTAIKTPTI